MKKYRLVEEKELIDLLESYNRLQALENGGVDNWEWYGASLGDFLEAWIADKGLDPDGDWDFTAMAEDDLNEYASCEF